MKLTELAKEYDELRVKMEKIEYDSSYFESVLLKYQGVTCYIDELSLYFEHVVLRVNNQDLDRFNGNYKTVKITLEEFDKEVTVIEEEN